VYHIKLTDAHGRTYGDTYWGPGVRHEAVSALAAPQLCTSAAIHFYSGDTLQEALALAVHMNPVQGAFLLPRAWVFEPEGEVVTDHVKFGCKAGTTVEEVALPRVILEQRVEVAIRCALEVCRVPAWREWAKKWLSGEDRSEEAAAEAGREAYWIVERASAMAARAAESLASGFDPVGAKLKAAGAAAVADESGWGPRGTVPIAKIAASVYYREEEADCTTSS
jgi:hypothetical protein